MRVAALGKKGSVSALLATLGKMTPDERKTQGPLINGLKDARHRRRSPRAARRSKAAALEARLGTETIDVTLPARTPPAEAGRIHPITQVMDELTAIFADMGFAVAEGPDIETDDYNFTRLNFPQAIRRGKCTTRSSSTRSPTARGCCCAPTPRRCRCAPC